MPWINLTNYIFLPEYLAMVITVIVLVFAGTKGKAEI